MTTKYAPHTQTSAIARAKSWVGKAKAKGWCQAWVVADIFGTGGVGDWDGDRAADAEDGWKKAVAKGKVVKAANIKSFKDIPAGLAMYWSGGSSDNGHAAVSAGGGKIYSTDLPTTGKVGLVDANVPRTKWGLTFLGYVLVEGNGYTLTDPPAKDAVLDVKNDAGDWVIVKDTLAARTEPEYKSGNVKVIRAAGLHIYTTKAVYNNGRWWHYRPADGCWYQERSKDGETLFMKRTASTHAREKIAFTSNVDGLILREQPYPGQPIKGAVLNRGDGFAAIGYEDIKGTRWHVDKDYRWASAKYLTEPAPTPTGPARFTLAVQNVLGQNHDDEGHPWDQRLPHLKNELLGKHGARASVLCLIEVNTSRQHDDIMAMLGKDTGSVRAVANNHMYFPGNKQKILSKNEFSLGSSTSQKRAVTIAELQHVATGVRWVLADLHLSSATSGATAAQASASRTKETTELVRLLKAHNVDVVAGDLNNYVVEPTTPRGLIEAAGYTDWRDLTDVENATYNTHHGFKTPPPQDGQHIDAIYVNADRVSVKAGRVQIDEPKASDHFDIVAILEIN